MYQTIFLGGTFDGLHKGHEKVLSTAFMVGEKVVIGLTTEDFVTSHKPQAAGIKPFEKRKEELGAWLTAHKLQDRATIIAITDPFEPAVSIDLDAIIVTPDNRHRGDEINRRRQKSGLHTMTLIEVPMVIADDGLPISSTRIRKGEIDREGKLVMPEELRPILEKPLGELLIGPKIHEEVELMKGKTIITVGDVATKTFIESGVIPSLSIIDLHVKREPYDTLRYFPDTMHLSMMTVRSGPGYISREAIEAIRGWAMRKDLAILVVDGEEDLLTLPAIVYAPPKSFIYYGQPNEGLVKVETTEKKKDEMKFILQQFT